ncbi:hypothetical protein J6590_003205 [Homalodisca vitripennis]|nr:hypothetical protein J6590_003205 [Homalodisca vitripennis]
MFLCTATHPRARTNRSSEPNPREEDRANGLELGDANMMFEDALVLWLINTAGSHQLIQRFVDTWKTTITGGRNVARSAVTAVITGKVIPRSCDIVTCVDIARSSCYHLSNSWCTWLGVLFFCLKKGSDISKKEATISRPISGKVPDLTSQKLVDLGRDLRSRKYRSEMLLAISAGFGDATLHFREKKRKTSLEIAPNHKLRSLFGLLLDIKKAFDTVNHIILILKQHELEIRGDVLKWFVSYRKNRQQLKPRSDSFDNLALGWHATNCVESPAYYIINDDAIRMAAPPSSRPESVYRHFITLWARGSDWPDYPRPDCAFPAQTFEQFMYCGRGRSLHGMVFIHQKTISCFNPRSTALTYY